SGGRGDEVLAGGEEGQLHAGQAGDNRHRASHARPSSPPARASTGSTKRDSRSRPARTSAIGPAARTVPLLITASESQSCSTVAMTWLEKTTDPPLWTNLVRMFLMVVAETGS